MSAQPSQDQWPITSFTSDAGIEFSFAGSSPDEYIFQLIARNNDFYENDLLRMLTYLDLRPGEVAVDVGANIGNHSVFFACVLGLKVVAFEPVEDNFVLLRHNVALNRADLMVETIQLALGSTKGEVEMLQRHSGNSGTYQKTEVPGGPVRMDLLDEQLDRRVPVALLKIDTEGDELEVLEGAVETIQQFSPVICIEAHDGPAFRKIDMFLQPFGYQALALAGRSDNYIYIPARSSHRSNRLMRAAALRSQRLIEREVVGHRHQLTSLEGKIESSHLVVVQELRQQHEALRALEANRLSELDALKLKQGLVEAESDLKQQTIDRLVVENRRLRESYAGLHRSRALHAGRRIRELASRLGLVSPPARLVDPSDLASETQNHQGNRSVDNS